jgi:uncharacterized protein
MICNASPLIIFSKVKRLDLLCGVTDGIIIPQAVYEEVVVQGQIIHASDALLVKDFVDKGNICVCPLNKEGKKKAKHLEQMYRNIDYGEAETIALALEKKEKMVLIDEKNAREVAKLHGLIPKGSLYILLLAFQKKHISEKEVKDIVTLMTRTKFHLGGDVMNTFWMIVERIKKQ